MAKYSHVVLIIDRELIDICNVVFVLITCLTDRTDEKQILSVKQCTVNIPTVFV